MPTPARGFAVPTGPGRGVPVTPQAFFVPFRRPALYTISGVTRDSAGVALGGCTVELFETVTPQGESFPGDEPHGMLRASTVSDASGNYSFGVTSTEMGLTFQCKAYKAGAPDVAGVTVNTLVGVSS